MDHIAVHIGEPKIAPLVAEGQFGVIDAHEMEDRGIEIMNVHRSWSETMFVGAFLLRGKHGVSVLVSDVVAQLISLTIGDPGLHGSVPSIVKIFGWMNHLALAKWFRSLKLQDIQI